MIADETHPTWIGEEEWADLQRGPWRFPTRPLPTIPDVLPLVNYVNALDAHDWDFERSDDQTNWHRGCASLRKLEEQAKVLDPDFALWNDRCPPNFRRKT